MFTCCEEIKSALIPRSVRIADSKFVYPLLLLGSTDFIFRQCDRAQYISFMPGDLTDMAVSMQI